MSDRREKIDPDHSIPENPTVEPDRQKNWTPDRLRQFSHWLKRWANDIQSRADLIAGQVQAVADPDTQPARDIGSAPASRSTSRAVPPAHWHGASSQGPPAHWLALFESQQPGGQANAGQSRDEPQVLEGDQPHEATETPMAWLHRFQAELAGFLALPGVSNALVDGMAPPQKLPGVLSGHIEADSENSQVPAPENPAAPIPGPGSNEAVTWIQSQDSEAAPEGNAPVLLPPDPAAFDSVKAQPVSLTGQPDPGQKRLFPDTQSLPDLPDTPGPGKDGDGVTQLQIQSPATNGSLVSDSAAHSLLEAQTGQRVTRLRLRGTSSNKPISDGYSAPAGAPGQTSRLQEPVSESDPGPEGQEPSAINATKTTPPQPGRMPPYPGADGSKPAAAVWHEPQKPTKAVPLRWPEASTQSQWPKLPDISPMRNPDPSPHQDPNRRRRIDREQGGRPWSG